MWSKLARMLSMQRYVCMYVCIHVCMYVCMYVLEFIEGCYMVKIAGESMNVAVCIHVCMYVCMNVCMYVCMCFELIERCHVVKTWGGIYECGGMYICMHVCM
jgi:hypothetical protein